MTNRDLPYDGPVVIVDTGLVSDADYEKYVSEEVEDWGSYESDEDQPYADVAAYLEDLMGELLDRDCENEIGHASIIKYGRDRVVIEGKLYDDVLSKSDIADLKEQGFNVKGDTVRYTLYPEDGGYYRFD